MPKMTGGADTWVSGTHPIQTYCGASALSGSTQDPALPLLPGKVLQISREDISRVPLVSVLSEGTKVEFGAPKSAKS